MKVIKTGKEARQKLADGAKLLFDCVSPTLSPRGRNVAISRKWNTPYINRDGVTVARAVEHKDEFVQMGVDIVRQAAEKTVVEVGDATTTTVILAHHLVSEGMKIVDGGYNPMKLRNELKDAVIKVSERVKELSKPVSTDAEIEHVATVASGSEELGKLVTEALKKTGKDGQITVEETKQIKNSINHVQGMTLDKGFVHQLFITNPQQMEAIVENPWIVVTKRKISLPEEILPILTLLVKMNPSKKFAFFGDIAGDALQIIFEQKYKGNISAVVCDVPGYGPRREAYLEDIATLTGAQVLDSQIGQDLDTLNRTLNEYSFGIAKSVVANNKSTTILPSEITTETSKKIVDRIEANKKAVDTKIVSLRSRVKNEESDYERELLQERLAKLTTGVAVIKIGTKTEVENREQVELAKDAIGSVKAAMAEGVVSGGETTLVRSAQVLDTKDMTKGADLLRMVLSMPFYKLMENVGLTDSEADEMFETLFIKNKDTSKGYDVLSGSIVDMIKVGIVDPTKVIRMAIENAVSVASSILTTDVLIAEEYVDVNKYELRRTD